MSPVVTICTGSLTFTNSTFCSYRLYLCVLCGSENKQRLFPYTALTDRFFITETESVYCAVRTGSIYIIHITISLQGPCYGSGAHFPTSQSSGLGPVSCQSMWDLWWTEVTLGQIFGRIKKVFPRQYHSTNAPYSSSSTCCSYPKDRGAKTGNYPRSNAAPESVSKLFQSSF